VKPLWYVIHCETGKDRQVEHFAVLAGLETFDPRIPCTRKRNGDKPLFPGYVFARLDLSADDGLKIRGLPGVRRLVDAGGHPCSIDEGLIEVIRRRSDSYRGEAGRPFAPGDRVRVIGGSFADLEGIFSEALSGHERVAILIDMMRREIRLVLPAGEVERVVQGAAA
jgi:transcriptional antiterminator RfaH